MTDTLDDLLYYTKKKEKKKKNTLNAREYSELI